jgi:hypothetical protein
VIVSKTATKRLLTMYLGTKDGWDVTMLKAKSGHASLRSLERYAGPGTEALARMQQGRRPEPAIAETDRRDVTYP